jgi:hypothetical protein
MQSALLLSQTQRAFLTERRSVVRASRSEDGLPLHLRVRSSTGRRNGRNWRRLIQIKAQDHPR